MTRDVQQPEGRPLASSPCSMKEFEDYAPGAVIGLLNELIEGERAGARGLLEMAKAPEFSALQPLLREVAADEARFCAMLTRHVARLGGEPSPATGVFADKLAGRQGLDAKLALLDKGQGVVVQMLEEMIPRIGDDALRSDLIEMRDVHRVNIERCAQATISG